MELKAGECAPGQLLSPAVATVEREFLAHGRRIFGTAPLALPIGSAQDCPSVGGATERIKTGSGRGRRPLFEGSGRSPRLFRVRLA